MTYFCQGLLVSFLGWRALWLPPFLSFNSPSAADVSLEVTAELLKKKWRSQSKSKDQTDLAYENLQGVGKNICLALFQFCWHEVKMYKMSWSLRCQSFRWLHTGWSLCDAESLSGLLCSCPFSPTGPSSTLSCQLPRLDPGPRSEQDPPVNLGRCSYPPSFTGK